MEDRFRAYTFVDRITSVQPGERIRGSYTVPAGLDAFPMPLVAEATGQLAAWAAGAKVDFAYQPVAGIAGRIDFLGAVAPGDTLELEAELERVDTEAINYAGTASVNGSPVLKLHDCLGPMLPMEDFDDPASVRSHFELLCGDREIPGAGGFGGIPDLVFEPVGGETGEWFSAAYTVPESAQFFGDHFPRNPVFPGTLVLEMNSRISNAFLARDLPPTNGRAWRVRCMNGMKIRSFLPPGEQLEVRIDIEDRTEDTVDMLVVTRKGKRIVSGGRSTLELKEVRA